MRATGRQQQGSRHARTLVPPTSVPPSPRARQRRGHRSRSRPARRRPGHPVAGRNRAGHAVGDARAMAAGPCPLDGAPRRRPAFALRSEGALVMPACRRVIVLRRRRRRWCASRPPSLKPYSGFSAWHSLTVVSAVGSDEFSGRVGSTQAECVPGRSITLYRAAGSGLTDLAAATATKDAQGAGRAR